MKSAFFHGEFENDEEMRVESQEEFEYLCPSGALLLLLKQCVV